jgi:aminopeptidase
MMAQSLFSQKQLERYADILIWGLKKARKSKFKKLEIILIRYHIGAVALAEILYRKLLESGYNPLLKASSTPVMEKTFFELGNNKQLVFQEPGEEELYRHLNGSIFLHAPESITHLSHVDSKKISRFTLSKKYLRDIMDQRDEQGLFSWTLCMYPTVALARHAGLTMQDYTKQIIKACHLNRRSPVVLWEELYQNAASIKDWLNKMDVVKYQLESDHLDLQITPGQKRKWIGLTGHNIPSFELFLSPDWRGTSGFYYADQPSFRSGNYVEGVKLTFKKGSAVKVEAEQGEDFVRKQLAMDQGASRLGEFSLTDRRFSKIDKFMANTLYDENYGGQYGNCHIALGSSYSDTYNGNPSELTSEKKKDLGFNDSALHWDLVNTQKKRVVAHLKSGKRQLIYENGIFVY